MMITRYLVIPIMLLAGSLACKKSDGVPVLPSGNQNLIKNSSFESANSPSLEGWQIETNVPTTISFSNNVPPNGGRWSVLFSVGDRVISRLRQSVPATEGIHRYQLSVWAKALGYPGKMSLLVNNVTRASVTVQDSVWRFYYLTDTISASRGDSLVVILDAGVTLSYGQTYFDLCTLYLAEDPR